MRKSSVYRSMGLLAVCSVITVSCNSTTGTTGGTDGTGNPSGSGQPISGMYMRHYNLSRTGTNPNESILTPANVAPGNFGKVFTFPTDAYVYAQPLYVPGVNVPGMGTYNVLYVATENDSVYAFDADGSTTNPLWVVNFTNLAQSITSVEQNDTQCPDIGPNIGITGTPTIDPNTGTLYVVAQTKKMRPNGSVEFFQHLHAIDITNGAERPNSPVEIIANDFDPLRANPRPGLVLANGKVYASFASSCDTGPYEGIILGYDAQTLQLVSTFYDAAGGNQAGIWMSGMAPAVDNNGNLYASTGNGTFDGINNFGCSVLKVTDSGSDMWLTDFFTPFDQASMNTQSIDLDVGSGGVVLLPDQPGPHPHLLVTAGKSGQIYVIDRDNMGQYDANDTSFSRIVQSWNMNGQAYAQDTFRYGLFGTPAFFNNKLYVAPVGSNIRAYTLTNGVFNPTPAASDVSGLSISWPGGSPTISANGTDNGILWFVVTGRANNVAPNPRQATLLAYDANNLAAGTLFNSDTSGPGNTMLASDVADFAVKHVSPTVVNGRVYFGTKTGVNVYGLLH